MYILFLSCFYTAALNLCVHRIDIGLEMGEVSLILLDFILKQFSVITGMCVCS